jgi:hypothetical protein
VGRGGDKEEEGESGAGWWGGTGSDLGSSVDKRGWSKGWQAALVAMNWPVTERCRRPKRGAGRSSSVAYRGSWAAFDVRTVKSRKKEKEEKG